MDGCIHIYIYKNICIYIYQPLNIRNLRPENLAYYRKLLVLVYERTEALPAEGGRPMSAVRGSSAVRPQPVTSR